MLMKSEKESEFESVATDHKPPSYDATQTEEEREAAAMSQYVLELFGIGSSTGPSVSGFQYRVFLLICLMLSVFLSIIDFSFGLSDKVTTTWSLVRAMVHIIGFTAIVLEKHTLLKAFLVPFTMAAMVDIARVAYETIALSPSFCRESAPFFTCFSVQLCEGFFKAMGSIATISVIAFEAFLLHMLLKVVEHDETIENLKKQDSFKKNSLKETWSVI